jgi:subtilisin family serine protease
MCLLAVLLGNNKVQAVQYAYQVTFTDKNNTPYSLGSPLAYLSSRSTARRTAQGIAIDSTDLPVNNVYVDSVLHLTGGTLHNVSRWLNHCVILITDSTQIHNLDGKTFISSKQLVAYYPGFLHKSTTTTSTSTATSSSLDATYYGNTWNQTLMVNGASLHETGHMGSGKLIAVLDAGFIGTDTHTGFDSLRNSGRLLDSHNFTLASTSVYGYDTHGTKALSTMAGYVPGTYVGSAPLASYAIYVTEDGNSEQPIELLNMLSATERADSLGADIISSSLGYNTFPDFPSGDFTFVPDLDGKSTTAAKAANIATKKGMLFVASAGNEGGNSWNMVLTPGDADSALTIGSVNITGAAAFNSGYGPNAAGQVKPDVCAMGEPASIFFGAGYGTENGTSFSTPQVAGWAACLWQSNPSATPYRIRQAIIKCASRYTSPDTHLGYGIPNFQCTADLLGIVNPVPETHENWITGLPNPFQDNLQLSIVGDTEQGISFNMVDVAGKTVFTGTSNIHKGHNMPVYISMQHLPSGIYILKAMTATRQHVLKLEKL